MGDRWIWGVTTLDQLAMVYMLVPLAQRPAGVTSVFVGYLVLAALAWLVNPLAVVDAIRSRPGPVLEVRAAVATAAARQPAPLPVDAVDRTEDALPASDSHPDSTGDSPSVPMRIAADLTLGVRITLAIMAVAMAWMLLAMQQMDSSDMHHNHHADMSPSLSWSR